MSPEEELTRSGGDIMRTNLERVRELLVREGLDLSVKRLDAHLKEDAAAADAAYLLVQERDRLREESAAWVKEFNDSTQRLTAQRDTLLAALRTVQRVVRNSAEAPNVLNTVLFVIGNVIAEVEEEK